MMSSLPSSPASPGRLSPSEAAAELQRRRSSRKGLLDFTRYTKPDYEVNWHHRVLCEFLDRFVQGEIKRLMVFMPPRHGKSELVSRRLPAYIMGRRPELSIISCSYNATLASRMNRDVQRIIDSPQYKAAFPETRLNDSNVRTNGQGSYLRNSDIFEIVGHQGVYTSAGIGGGITGMGMHVGIIDDPIKNQEEALSPTIREKVWEWYTSTFYTRLEKDAQILLTMTRWHEDDLAGRLLSKGKVEGEEWTIIKFPAVATIERCELDPRDVDEPLWPNKYSRERLRAIEITQGPYKWSALYQQNPVPIEGGMWKYESIESGRLVEGELPEMVKIVVAVDPAVTSTEGSDETGIIVCGVGTDGYAYVLEDLSMRASPLEWAKAAISAYHRWDADRVVAEVNNGGELVEATIRTVDPLVSYLAVHASRGKQIRAEPIAALYEQGRIRHAGHFTALEDQMTKWVQGERSPDRMDALVWALTVLMPQLGDSGEEYVPKWALANKENKSAKATPPVKRLPEIGPYSSSPNKSFNGNVSGGRKLPGLM